MVETLFQVLKLAPKEIPADMIEKEIQNPSEKLYKVLDELSPGYGTQFEPVAGFHMQVHTKLLQKRLQSLLDAKDTSTLNVFAAVYATIKIPRYGYLKKLSLMILYKILYLLTDYGDLTGLQGKIPESKSLSIF